MLILYLVGSPLALTGMDISTQLAVMTPLLIIVRVGLGLTHGLPSMYKIFLNTTGQMTFSERLRSSRGVTGSAIQISTIRDVVSTEDTQSVLGDYALQEFKISGGFNQSVESQVKFAPGEGLA
ncbi:hypothetical protein SCP_0201780 [Sparassis crispa]|uniref:Uncharacterized protein n=1 Tax=Sparassis crispa TaxID=139825 RepID=A0A401G9Z9_9APHY|nr:hypothetical protein SCP_0201780 [Sparassis crispa]GBE78981.1 hypothetical protein SCP_0201780 [Sparassis crispa]